MEEMQTMKNFLQQYSQKTPYSSKQSDADYANKKTGDMNETDGVDCPICKNKGYILFCENKGDIPTYKACKCMKQRKIIRKLKEKGFQNIANYSLDTYDAKHKWQIAIKGKVQEYINNGTDKWLCLLGQSGVGKTHLCGAVAKNFIEKGRNVELVQWVEFANTVKKEALSSEDKTILAAKESDVLYIDDLFKGNVTDADKRIVFDLINYRYLNDLTTIISSELTMQDLSRVDQAICGRIVEKCGGAGGYYFSVGVDASKNYRLNKKAV